MFAKCTVFNWLPALPGGVRPYWQGIGLDRGYTVVHGDAGAGTDWYIVRGLGGTLTAATPSGTDALEPEIHYPSAWWRGSVWAACPDDLSSPVDWTLVSTRLTGWRPREWQYPYLDEDHQGTTDPSEIGTRWYGDSWYLGGLPRGILKRYQEDPDAPMPVATTSYAWGDVWKWHSGGSAPAGVYIRPEGGHDTRNVGFWIPEEQEYRLTEEEGGHDSLAPMAMCSPGLLRLPAGDQTDPFYSPLPSTWDFDGADWEEPDPMDWRYWHCVRAACMERESVADGGSGVMGSLIPDEQALWGLSPLDPPSLSAVRAVRAMIHALAEKYVDLARVREVLENGGLPYLRDVHVDLSGYAHLNGGWERGDPVRAEAMGDLSGFLAEACQALRSMVVCLPQRVFLNAYRHGNAYTGYGASPAAAWSQAMGEYQADDPEWQWWTVDRGALRDWVGVDSVIDGRSGAEAGQTGDTYTSVFGMWETRAISLCLPTTSVLDGAAMAPEAIYVADSKRPDYEIGQHVYNGTVQAVSYYSSNPDLAEGVTTGLLRLPASFLETPPGGPYPSTPGAQYDTQWHMWGSTTTYAFYAYWGAAFHFGGPRPPLDTDDDSNS